MKPIKHEALFDCLGLILVIFSFIFDNINNSHTILSHVLLMLSLGWFIFISCKHTYTNMY